MAFGLQQTYYGDQQTGLAGLGGGNQWIDPRTGQLLRQPDPSRPGEMQAAQAAMSAHADQLAMQSWKEQMAYLDKTSGAGKIDPEPIINKGTEEIGASQRADTRGLRRALAASGGAGAGGSGAQMQGLSSLGSKYAGMRANLARDTRIQTDAFNASNRDRERQMKFDLMRNKPMPRPASLEGMGGPGFKMGGSLQTAGGGAGKFAYRPPKWAKGDSGFAPGFGGMGT